MECMQIHSFDELAFQAGSGVYHLVNSTSPIADLLCFFAFDFIIVTKSSVVGKTTRKQHNIYEKSLAKDGKMLNDKKLDATLPRIFVMRI